MHFYTVVVSFVWTWAVVHTFLVHAKGNHMLSYHMLFPGLEKVYSYFSYMFCSSIPWILLVLYDHVYFCPVWSQPGLGRLFYGLFFLIYLLLSSCISYSLYLLMLLVYSFRFIVCLFSYITGSSFLVQSYHCIDYYFLFHDILSAGSVLYFCQGRTDREWRNRVIIELYSGIIY